MVSVVFLRDGWFALIVFKWLCFICVHLYCLTLHRLNQLICPMIILWISRSYLTLEERDSCYLAPEVVSCLINSSSLPLFLSSLPFSLLILKFELYVVFFYFVVFFFKKKRFSFIMLSIAWIMIGIKLTGFRIKDIHLIISDGQMLLLSFKSRKVFILCSITICCYLYSW